VIPAGIVFNKPLLRDFRPAATWALLEAALGVPRHELSAVSNIAGVPMVRARAR